MLQMTSGVDPEANCGIIERAIMDASAQGARLLFTPEMALMLDRDRSRAASALEQAKDRRYERRLRECAARHGIWLALGSAAVQRPDGRLANRSFLFAPDRRPPVTYDKMHMFDVELSSAETWQESAAFTPGDAVVHADDTPVGRLGLTICYDVRFPALFEALGRRACDALAIPSAFTLETGAAHWHLLLRARAVEATAFVFAAAQVGTHEDGRRTYGHSLVVDPWGEVLLDMGGEEARLAVIDIDLGRVAAVRRRLPSLANRRTIPT